jgi:dienelactone hydrolase
MMIWLTGCMGLSLSSCHQQSAEHSKIELCVGEYLSESEGAEKLMEYATAYSNASEWKERAAEIRKHVRQGAQLDQIPAEEWQHEIRVTRGAKHQLDGYTVENVGLEVKPGIAVHGNLYMPLEFEGKIPAILCPHGHWNDLVNNDYGRFRPDMQFRCAALASMGAAVFAWDMLGYGEDITSHHKDPKAVQKQCFNSMRVLDYICSLDFVDDDRLAVTGASGGGTQTFLLAALDERIDVAVPTVMVSAHFFGGCICESGMPIHKSGEFETNNVEIAASIAPKPLMLISNGDDWTKNVPQVEYPYIQAIYQMFEAEDKLEQAYFPDEVHDYGPSKRKAAYLFLAKHLNLDYHAILDPDGNVTEQFVTLLDTTALKVFPERNLVSNTSTSGWYDEEKP